MLHDALGMLHVAWEWLLEWNIVSTFFLLLFVLAMFFILAMFWKTFEEKIRQLLGLNKKNETLTYLGLAMGGVVLLLQALIANGHTEAIKNTANAQVRANHDALLKHAIEHLGNDKSASVRLGGAYELIHLAQDGDMFGQTVLDILCAYIRWKTNDKEYQEKHKSEPSQEIQNLLTLLFVNSYNVFHGYKANLAGAQLHGTDFREARLHGADFREARLHGADLTGARLHGADLTGARLHGADLAGAQLHGADLTAARLYGTDLTGAQFYGAILRGAQLQGAAIGKAQFQEADLEAAHFGGARNWGTSTFQKRMSMFNEDYDISEVTFEGGLKQENLSLIGEGLTPEDAKGLQERLLPHFDLRLSHELSENRRVIAIKFYKEKEAREWISEYEKAMINSPP